MIRVTLVSHFFPAHRGGVEVVAGKLAQALTSGHDVEIDWFASDDDSIPDDLGPSVRCLPQASWNGLERRLGFPWPVWSPWALTRLARSIRLADVVHVHDFIYMGSVIAALLAWRYHKPLVITQHIGYIPYKNPLLRLALSAINHTLGAVILRHAAKVVFISVAVQDYFSSFVRWKRPPCYIPNGTDIAVFHPLPNEQRLAMRQTMGMRPDRPAMLFVGRFVEKKGLGALHLLAQDLPQTDWFFAGVGPLDPAIWQLPHVRVFSGLQGFTLAPLYQTADLLILPSLGEGFPLVIQESMACGTPVLVSSETAEGCPAAERLMLHEAIGGHGALEKWKQRLQYICQHPEQLQDLRPLVADFAKSQWDWRPCAATYHTIFASFSPHL